MTMDKKGTYSPASDTTSYQSENDPYGIERRTHDVFVPPQLEDTSYVPHQDVKEAQGETQKRIARRRARSKRKKLARQRQLQRRNRRLAAAAGVVFIFLVWLILRFFPIPFGTIIIDGNDRMSFDDVYQSCGIQNGIINVIQLSPDRMRERMEKDLRVASADISREFPATIHIRMQERQTVAVITTMYGFAYVDDTGMVIETAPQIKGVSAPLITGKKVDTLLLGDTIHDQPIRSSLSYLKSLAPELRKDITEINVGNPDNIIAYTSESLPVHLGSADDPAGRAEMTKELLQEVKRNQLSVQYIDTDPRAPLVKSN